MLLSRDRTLLNHMVRYCEEIFEARERFGNSCAAFSSNSVYRNAVALCVLQIGELTAHLTNDFKTSYCAMPWNQMKALRNVVAHNYGHIDVLILWETVEFDIPALHKYCHDILCEEHSQPVSRFPDRDC